MKAYRPLTFLLATLVCSSTWAASPAVSNIIVIGNLGSEQTTLSRDEVRNIYMGSNSKNLKPVALPPNNIARIIFNTKVIGLTESRIQSYWAQMRFTGRNKPPMELDTDTDIIHYLQKHPRAIGYTSVDTPIPSDLTIVYQPD